MQVQYCIATYPFAILVNFLCHKVNISVCTYSLRRNKLPTQTIIFASFSSDLQWVQTGILELFFPPFLASLHFYFLANFGSWINFASVKWIFRILSVNSMVEDISHKGRIWWEVFIQGTAKPVRSLFKIPMHTQGRLELLTSDNK